MSKIMFFCIPAHGHINPTLAVVTELVKRGYQVRYYAMEEFKEKIGTTGAEYISCDQYMPPAPEDLDQKVGKDFASLIEMVVDTTTNMDEMMKAEMESFRPDCVVADSVCFWGKLFAKKYGIPFVCSTTTMAFNQHTAVLMKQGLGEIIRLFKGMPRINRKFQPMAETFSDKYAFVGPSVAKLYPRQTGRKRPQVYISLGTVLHDNPKFYRRCVKALRDVDCDVIISAGKKTDISALGEMPANFRVYPYVNQMEVLARTDVFLTHCGMNSVSESLYNGVPMVLFPQHSEENAVAMRTEQLGAGVRLKRASSGKIKKSVLEVITNDQYRKCAEEMSRDFAACGGPVMAAEFIESAAQ